MKARNLIAKRAGPKFSRKVPYAASKITAFDEDAMTSESCMYVCICVGMYVCIHMYVSAFDEDAMTSESCMHVCICIYMYSVHSYVCQCVG